MEGPIQRGKRQASVQGTIDQVISRNLKPSIATHGSAAKIYLSNIQEDGAILHKLNLSTCETKKVDYIQLETEGRMTLILEKKDNTLCDYIEIWFYH